MNASLRLMTSSTNGSVTAEAQAVAEVGVRRPRQRAPAQNFDEERVVDYPNRRQMPAKLRAFIDLFRHRA
ncbi:MAG: hypothetical protein JNK82_30985 [Myxococcaceae bacterium]|nr:hypothetical protein [Myxococcaceae bacterium]